jgi:hypothetical protein
MNVNSEALQVQAWLDTRFHMAFTITNASDQPWVVWNVYSEENTGIGSREPTTNAAAILYGGDGTAIVVQGRNPDEPGVNEYRSARPDGSRVGPKTQLRYEISENLPVYEWMPRTVYSPASRVHLTATPEGPMPRWESALVSKFDICVEAVAGGKATSLDGYPELVSHVDGGDRLLLRTEIVVEPAVPMWFSLMNERKYLCYTREYWPRVAMGARPNPPEWTLNIR